MQQYHVGYLHYIVVLFVVTGWILLRYERKVYNDVGMTREGTFARVLGWINILMGGLASITNWFIGAFVG